MNYNPYYYNAYVSPLNVNKGLFKTLFNSQTLNFTNILTNTQKVLNIANQAIPVIKQVSPIMKNATTMFKVMNEFKKVESPTIVKDEKKMNKTEDNTKEIKQETYMEGPTFFI